MATEIELKAHVEDSEALRLILSNKADYLGVFEKDDTYWYPSGASPLSPYGLRVRRVKRTLPGRKAETAVFATYKTKDLRSGYEVNDEREFEIRSSSSSPPAEVFEELLTKLGLKSGAGKQKRGWVFYKDGINAELVEVEGLGWFVELEILSDSSQEASVAKARKQLLDFLDELGISAKAIESRSYLTLLAKQ